MKVKAIGLSGVLLTVSLCFFFSACSNIDKAASISGLANEKCANRQLGLAESGDYVYFVGKTAKLNSDGSSAVVMRFGRDGGNLVLLGDTAKYTEIVSGTVPGVSAAEPKHLEYISCGRIFIQFTVTFLQTAGDNDGHNSDTIEMICDMDLNGDDFHFDIQKAYPNAADTVSCPEDSASDGYWNYFSVIDEVIESESKIYREKIDQTGKEVFYEGHAENLQIRDGWLFFASYAAGEGTISCINLDSGTKKDIYVYYFREHNIGNISLCGNWIYFVDYAADGHLCRIRTDGTGLSIISDRPIIEYCIFGHTIMYQEWESYGDDEFALADAEGINLLYRMDLDGSNIQTIT